MGYWRASVAAVLLLSGVAAPAAAAQERAPAPPAVSAGAWVVADARTGAVLGWRDPHGWYRPASTLKMLTAVALIPALSPGAYVRASARSAHVIPNVAGLVPGHSYRVSDLFRAMLTISANDAAVALAEATGSYARGIALMNAEASRLGARDTVAVDPNGLDAPGQHTSAYDLALIARQALRMPAFMRYDSTRSFVFRVSSRRAETLYNQNRLLTEYVGGIGGKIGWTSAAGATYVGMARRHGVTLIATLLHCPALTETVAAERLLNWGFAVDGRIRPVGRLVSAPAGARSRAVRHAAPTRRAEAIPHGSHGTLAAWAFTGLAVLLVAGSLARLRGSRRVALWP